MITLVDRVVSEALELPKPLRAFVAEALIESLDSGETAPLSIKWKREVRRRCKEIDEGAAELRDAKLVFERAYAALS